MELSTSEKFQIQRINEISLMARTTWFGLLAYLAFVGITLLAVEDADFFVPSRQTHLPLINVAIPTKSFFWFAPILGTALYAYLHLQLLKLWDALAAPDPRPGDRPLADHVYPWLINDFALTYRRDGAIERRPLVFLSSIVTRLLVWLAGPLVLAGFWVRSMPAHNEWLTMTVAICLCTAVYVGLTAWWRAEKCLLRLSGTPWSGWWKRPFGIALLTLTIVSSWVVTEGGFDHYANRIVTAWNDARDDNWLRTCDLRSVVADGEDNPAPPKTCLDRQGQQRDPADLDAVDWLRIQERQVADTWLGFSLERLTFDTDDMLIGFFLGEDENWTTLAPTNLAGVDLVARPGGLLEYDVHRRRFRSEWCGRQGLSPAACGPVLDSATHPPPHQAPARAEFCDPIDDASCKRFFAGLEEQFGAAWRDERAAKLGALAELPLTGADLRGANLNNAFLSGADLTGARMEGANLRGARMEGGDLRGARMEGADLRGARMEGADLRGARMEGADLRGARMEGANLRGARVEGAVLWEARVGGATLRGARMDGADLRGARMEGADLREARMEWANLIGARMEGAVLWEARMEGTDLRGARMDGADLRGARVERADLRGARMEGADFGRARMEGADLRGARMEGADLRGARMEGANFRGARVEGADCSRAVFFAALLQSADFNCRNLARAQLQFTVGDVDTKLPAGMSAWSCLDRDRLSEDARAQIDAVLLRYPQTDDLSGWPIARSRYAAILFCDPASDDPFRRRPVRVAQWIHDFGP